jgi:hypothetical protein
MRLLALQALPNQELSFTLGGSTWRIRIMRLISRYGADVYRNEEVVALGIPISPNWPIIPYPYQRTHGDFILDTPGGAELDNAQFGISQNLYYLAPDEVPDV